MWKREAALSSIPRVVILSLKKEENWSQGIRGAGFSLDVLASLLDWCLTRSNSLRGRFLALSNSVLKNSFLELRMFFL